MFSSQRVGEVYSSDQHEPTPTRVLRLPLEAKPGLLAGRELPRPAASELPPTERLYLLTAARRDGLNLSCQGVDRDPRPATASGNDADACTAGRTRDASVVCFDVASAQKPDRLTGGERQPRAQPPRRRLRPRRGIAGVRSSFWPGPTLSSQLARRVGDGDTAKGWEEAMVEGITWAAGTASVAHGRPVR